MAFSPSYWATRLRESSPTIRNSTLSAGGGSGNCDGIYNDAATLTYTVTVDNCQITGSTHSIYNGAGGVSYTTYVGASLLGGGTVAGSGAEICVFSYDETYTALDGSCQ